METSKQILEVARDLFLKHGIEGVTMRRVAKEVGISATAIYRHFQNKDELLKHVVDFGRNRFIKSLAGMYDSTEPKQRIRAALHGYLDFGLSCPHDYKIMFQTADQIINGVHTFDYETVEGSSYGPNTFYFLNQIKACLPHDQQHDEGVDDAFFLLWCQCHGLVSAYLTGGVNEIKTEKEFREMYRRLIERLLSSLFE